MPKKQTPAADTPLALNAAMAAYIHNEMMIRRGAFAHLIDPKKDIDTECGYPVNPGIRDYRLLYDREGVATRVNDIYPEETWSEPPEVLENPSGEFTPWEIAWNDLVKNQKIFDELKRADRLSGIGSYGILIIGINDGKRLSEPVDGIDLRTGKRSGNKTTTNATKRELLYLRALDESVLSISRYESDTSHPRYGQPIMYQVNMAQDGCGVNSPTSSGNAMSSPELQSMEVHWTRVIHLADNCGNSKVFGVPRLRKNFNRCYDIRKILGGAGEMFWKGGFPGLAIETNPNLANQAPLTPDEKKDVREEVERYQQTLQRYMALSGMTAKSLAPQVADPSNQFETMVKAICAGEGVPYRIFIGTEEAQLAGAQDKKAWNKRIKHRQSSYAQPYVLEPFVDRLIAMGVVEETKYLVQWPDLDAPTQKDRSENAEKMTRAMAAYVTSGLDALMTPLDYLTSVCGYDTDEASAFLVRSLGSADGELPELDDEEEEVEKTKPAKSAPAKRK